MKTEGIKNLIKEICISTEKVNKEQVDAFVKKIDELPYLEHVVLRHLANDMSIDRAAKILAVSPNYIKHQRRKAIRHMRKPDIYYSLKLGLKGREEMLVNHTGETPVTACGFTTRTANTLIRNGFEYMEELEEYIGVVPERFAYIEGLGRYGMSEILYYYESRRR